jgi:hypothetical protein
MMTVLSRKPANKKNKIKPGKSITRQRKMHHLTGIYLMRPSHDPGLVERGQHLADMVRQELASWNNETLDQVMSRSRGRAWSS